MRFGFSQVPVYPQRVIDLVGLIYSGAGVGIAAAVACLGLFGEGVDFWTWQFLLTFGLWFALGLLLLLAGRSWARRQGLPFVPHGESRALQLARDRARPLPNHLLWDPLPSGFLIGLMVAQLNSAHPFWHADKLPWVMVAVCVAGVMIGGLIRRARAPSPEVVQEGTSA